MVSPADNSIGYRYHADIGGNYIELLGFAPEVAGAARLHVSAKRALVTMEPSYMNELSQASVDTLVEQGGPLSEDELEAFLAVPGADVALRLRKYVRLRLLRIVRYTASQTYRGGEGEGRGGEKEREGEGEGEGRGWGTVPQMLT